MKVLIVGAAGNLGSFLTKHLLLGAHPLSLLVHRKALSLDLEKNSRVCVIRGDLDVPASLREATRNIDCIVYVAGVLFQPRPERFLRRTNTVYVQNIVDAALVNGVQKFILVSFPHVEGETTPDSPATGTLDGHPNAIHSQTRLAAERYLFSACEGRAMLPLVLRAGIIYGRGV